MLFLLAGKNSNLLEIKIKKIANFDPQKLIFMIQLDEALKNALVKAFVLGTEKVDYLFSLNRILAKDIISDIDMPPFNKSAMDGYACRREDFEDELIVVETIRAGIVPVKKIKKGQCASIMTGAIIPEGADCVLMVEYVEKRAENRIIFTGNNSKDNICFKGEDVKKGQLVLKKGELIKAQHIAVMASVGCVNPLVFLRPKIGIIATGTELVEPAKKPLISQIRNSNASQMIAQVMAMGINAEYYGIAPDSEEETYNILSKCLNENDITILSGGVSMGEFDFVPQILKELGVKILFEKIAIKPGKPTTFGLKSRKFVWALPGNPVSSFVIFELLVKPFLYKMMDNEYQPGLRKLPVAKRIQRKKANKLCWMPGIINKEGSVEIIDYHGSAHINALAMADCLIAMKVGHDILESGELTDVRQI